MEELSDEELIRRLAGAEEEALEQLYDRYAAPIRGLAIRLLGDKAAAEEIVQETFWRAWKKAATFRENRGSARAWLFTIGHHLSVDALRRRRTRPQSPVKALDLLQLAVSQSGESNVPEAAWLKGQRERVRAAVRNLPPEQSQVIMLAYFQGLTRREIAEAIGEPLGTVHSRARLGLQKLRRALQAEMRES